MVSEGILVPLKNSIYYYDGMNILSKILFILLCPLYAFAFKLSPMVITFSPTGKGKTQVLTVENTGTEKVPLQLEAFTRSVNSKGEEVRAKTEDFNIFPEQLVLLPNEKRNIRITWMNSLTDKIEKSYRIVATQLPIEFKEKNSESSSAGVNLNFLLQYVASAYVKPEGANPSVKLKSYKQLDPTKIRLKIKNEGTAHQLLKTKNLDILLTDKSVIQIKDNEAIDSLNLLAGQEAEVDISLKNPLKTSIKNIELSLEKIDD